MNLGGADRKIGNLEFQPQRGSSLIVIGPGAFVDLILAEYGVPRQIDYAKIKRPAILRPFIGLEEGDEFCR